jgi:DNA-binding response OmpR family regulator
LVDDDDSITEALAALFEKEGYAVQAVKNGLGAIEECGKAFYNAALIDVRLPDIGGIELLRKLRSIHSRMVTIIVTGYPTIDNAVQALNVGADAYIMKPFNPRELVVTVKNKLNESLQNEVMTSKKIAEFIASRALEHGYESRHN